MGLQHIFHLLYQAFHVQCAHIIDKSQTKCVHENSLGFRIVLQIHSNQILTSLLLQNQFTLIDNVKWNKRKYTNKNCKTYVKQISQNVILILKNFKNLLNLPTIT